MDWLLISCCVVMAWVTLAVVSGERLRRQQQKTVENLAAAVEPVDSIPVVK